MGISKAIGASIILDPQNASRFGGKGRLAGDPPSESDPTDGIARVLNVPSRINLIVLEPVSMVVVARTISRDDGRWEVLYLNPDIQFTVIGVDLSRQVNSAIQDWIFPATME